MTIGARTAAWAKAGYTAKDYVKDGLIAMWDGIENAGWGVNDPNATVWKDLVGSHDLTVLYESFFYDDSFVIPDGSSKSNAGAYGSSINGIGAIEIVAVRDSASARFVLANNDLKRVILNPASGDLTTRVQWNNSSGYASECSVANGEVICAACIYGAGRIYAFTNGIPSSVSYSNGWSNNTGFTVGYSTSHGQFGAMRIKAIRLFDSTHTAAQIAANYAIDKARFGLT